MCATSTFAKSASRIAFILFSILENYSELKLKLPACLRSVAYHEIDRRVVKAIKFDVEINPLVA